MKVLKSSFSLIVSVLAAFIILAAGAGFLWQNAAAKTEVVGQVATVEGEVTDSVAEDSTTDETGLHPGDVKMAVIDGDHYSVNISASVYFSSNQDVSFSVSWTITVTADTGYGGVVRVSASATVWRDQLFSVDRTTTVSCSITTGIGTISEVTYGQLGSSNQYGSAKGIRDIGGSVNGSFTPIKYTITWSDAQGDRTTQAEHGTQASSISTPGNPRTKTTTYESYQIVDATYKHRQRTTYSGSWPSRTGTITGAKTYTANYSGSTSWEANVTRTYILSLYNNTGTSNSGDNYQGYINTTYNGAINLSSYPNASLSGWSFDGYWSAYNGGVQRIAADKSYTFSALGWSAAVDPTANLYASWKANLTLNKNGGTGGSNTVDFVRKRTAAEQTSVQVPTRTGYNFNGYWTAASGGTQYYNASGACVGYSGVYTSTAVPATTLYAQWVPKNNLILTFNGGTGAVFSSNNLPTYSITGLTYDSPIGLTLPAETVTNPTVKKDKYIFDGWYTAAVGGTQVTSSTVYGSNLSLDTSDNATIYAHWTSALRYLHFNLNYTGSIGNFGTTYIAYSGYTYSSQNSGIAEFAKPSPTEREGWKFVAWYSNAAGTGSPVTPASIHPLGNQDRTIYAKWEEKLTDTVTVSVDNYEFLGVLPTPQFTASERPMSLSYTSTIKYSFSSVGTDSLGQSYNSGNESQKGVFPTNVGTYTVTAYFPETPDYKKNTATNTFSVTKSTPQVVVSMSDYIYGSQGMTASLLKAAGWSATRFSSLGTELANLNNGSYASLGFSAESVVYYYSGTANDGTVIADSISAPTLAGSYTVVAQLPATPNFNAFIVTTPTAFEVERRSLGITGELSVNGTQAAALTITYGALVGSLDINNIMNTAGVLYEWVNPDFLPNVKRGNGNNLERQPFGVIITGPNTIEEKRANVMIEPAQAVWQDYTNSFITTNWGYEYFDRHSEGTPVYGMPLNELELIDTTMNIGSTAVGSAFGGVVVSSERGGVNVVRRWIWTNLNSNVESVGVIEISAEYNPDFGYNQGWNYLPATGTIEINVDKAYRFEELSTLTATYVDGMTLADISLPAKYFWGANSITGIDCLTTLADVFYDHDEGQNDFYYETEGEVSLQIEKATLGAFPSHASFSNIVYGTLLGDLTLASGYEWVSLSDTVGTAGASLNMHAADYTKNSNYNPIRGTVGVGVIPADTGAFLPYNGQFEVPFGTTLASIISDINAEGYYLVNSSDLDYLFDDSLGTVEDFAVVYYTNNDLINYNPSIAGTVAVKIVIADGVWVAPEALSATYGDTLADIKAGENLLSASYIWVSDASGGTELISGSSVGDAGVQRKYLKYEVYGYTDVVQQVVVTVAKKQSVWVDPNGGEPYAIESGAKLSTVSLPAGYRWVTPSGEGPIGAKDITLGSFAAIYFEGEDSNYLSDSGNISVTVTSYPDTAAFVAAGPYSLPYDTTTTLGSLAGLGLAGWNTDLYMFDAPETLIKDLGGPDSGVGEYSVAAYYRQTLYHNYKEGFVEITVSPLAGSWADPGALTAVYGDTLSAILAGGLALPSSYEWVTDITGAVLLDETTLVGNAGTQSGYLRYVVPNYTDVIRQVSITVAKKDSVWPGYSDIYMPSYMTLDQITLAFGNALSTWEWVSSGGEAVTGGSNDISVVYPVDGIYTAQVSYLENGDSANYNAVYGNVSVHVVDLPEATPTNPPSYDGNYTIVYSATATIADIDTNSEIKNSHEEAGFWYWVDSSDRLISSFGNADTTHQIAVWYAPFGFEPGVDEELPVRMLLNLFVEKGDSVYSGPQTFNAVYLDTLLVVMTKAGISSENYMWFDTSTNQEVLDPASVLFDVVGTTNQYQIKYRTSSNYNYSELQEVSITVANGTLSAGDSQVTEKVNALDTMIVDYNTYVRDINFTSDGDEILDWAWHETIGLLQSVGNVGVRQWRAVLTLPNYNPIEVLLPVEVRQISANVVNFDYIKDEYESGSIKYAEGQTLADISRILGATYAWADSSVLVGDVVFEGSEIGYKPFDAKYNPEGIGSTNYIPSNVTVRFKVYKAEAVWVEPILNPDNQLTYSIGAKVGDISNRLPADYYFVNPNDDIGCATNSRLLEVSFDPDTNHYPAIGQVLFVVNKADVEWIEYEYDGPFLVPYGKLLKDVILKEHYYWDFWGYAAELGSDYESAKWVKGVGNVGENTHRAVYNPDPKNYNNSPTGDIEITVNKTVYGPIVPSGLEFEIEYGKQLSTLYASDAFKSLPGGASEYRFESDYIAGVNGVGAGSGGADDYYYTLYRNNPISDINPGEPAGSSYISSWAQVKVRVVAAYVAFVPPSGNFNVPYGSVLGDVKILPEANKYYWAYIEEGDNLLQNGALQSVGPVTEGSVVPKDFVILYNPGGFDQNGVGSNNYISAQGTVKVAVVRSNQSFESPGQFVAQYGQKLEEIELPANYYWVNEDDVVGSVGTNRKIVRFNHDPRNYNWVYGEVIIEVSKADIDFVQPLWEFETTYEADKTIGAVGFILPYGYSWADGALERVLGDVAYQLNSQSEIVYDSNGNIIVVAKCFENALVYNPNSENYNDISGDIYIKILQKSAAFEEFDGVVQADYGQILADVMLPAMPFGSYRWFDAGALVGAVGIKDIAVWYLPTSHNLLPSSGTISVSVNKSEADFVGSLAYTSVYGTLVKNIVLPLNFVWDWQYYADKEGVSVEEIMQVLTVGNVFDNGKAPNKLRALYNDDAYNRVDTVVLVDIEVLKADVEWLSPDELLEAVYGQTLRAVKGLRNTYAWENDTRTVGNAGLRSFSAFYNPYRGTPLEANYKDAINLISVYVHKATGEAEVNIERWVSGDRLNNPEVRTATNSGSEMAYHYMGTNGTEYDSDMIPTLAGDYVVYITIAGNENYNAVTISREFSLLDAPQRDNSWWIWIVLLMILLVITGLIFIADYYRRRERQKDAGY